MRTVAVRMRKILARKPPSTTTQNLDFAEEMVRKGSVELDVCGSDRTLGITNSSP